MRIALDLLTITGKNAGLQSYARQLVTSLAKVDPESDYILLVNSRAEGLFDVPARNFRLVPIRTPKRFVGLWEQLALPARRILHRVDLLHSPVCAPPLRSPCRTVVTVHDLTFKLYPETMQWWDRLYWGYFLTRGAKRANKIIVPSKSTALALREILCLPEDRVVVVEECCSEIFFQRVSPEKVEITKKRYGITGRYVLTVGTLEPRKNIPTLLEAFSIVRKKKLAIQLVIAGARGWLDRPIFEKVEALGIRKDVVFTGFVPDEDLPALYQGADVFVYPSLYEGFGLPPLEAMASGTPVVASNSSSIPEVVGTSGILIDPQDVEGFARAIIKLCTDADYRAILGVKGQQRARQFTIERMGKKTAEIYREVLKEGK